MNSNNSNNKSKKEHASKEKTESEEELINNLSRVTLGSDKNSKGKWHEIMIDMKTHHDVILYWREFTKVNINGREYFKEIDENKSVICKTNTKEMKVHDVLLKSLEKKGNKIYVEYDDDENMIMSLYEIITWMYGLLRMKNNFRKYLTNNNINIFIPCHDATWYVEDDGTITGCFYHDRELHDDIFNNKTICDFDDKQMNNIFIQIFEDYGCDEMYKSYGMYSFENMTKKLQTTISPSNLENIIENTKMDLTIDKKEIEKIKNLGKDNKQFNKQEKDEKTKKYST